MALLRNAFLAPDPAPALGRSAARLAAGGLVREVAAERDLRRALPWLARALSDAGLFVRLPADERALLLAARLRGESDAARAARTLLPLGAALAPGTPALLLKGAALHGTLYPDAALRPLSDLDLFVPPVAVAPVRQALAAAGLAFDPTTAARLADYDASGGRAHRLSDLIARPPTRDGLAVELKLDPLQVGVPVRRSERFLLDARPSPRYPGLLVPSPEVMAVQQALHLARHDGSDLVWWGELAHGLARAARTGALRPRVLSDLVRGEGLLGTLRAVLREAEALFPGTVPRALFTARGGGVVLPRFRVRGRRGGATRGPASRPDERTATLGLAAVHAIGARRPFTVLASLLRRTWPSDGYVRAVLRMPVGARVSLPDRLARVRRLLRRAPSAS